MCNRIVNAGSCLIGIFAPSAKPWVPLSPTNVNLTLGSIPHGTTEPSSIPLGLAAPGVCNRPLHPATAGHLLDFHHPLSRSTRRTHIHLRRGASRRWTAPPVFQGFSPPQAHPRRCPPPPFFEGFSPPQAHQ